MPDLATLTASLAPLNAKRGGSPLVPSDWNLLVDTVLALAARESIPAGEAAVEALAARVEALEAMPSGGVDAALVAKVAGLEATVAELAGRLDALETRVASLDPAVAVARIEEIAARTGAVEARVEAVAENADVRLATLKDDASALAGRVDAGVATLGARLEEVASATEKLAARADEAAAATAGLVARADAGEGVAGAHAEALEKLDARVDALEEWKGGVDRRFDALAGGVTGGDVDLSAELGRLEVTLGRRLDGQDEALKALRTKIEAVDGGWTPFVEVLDGRLLAAEERDRKAEEAAAGFSKQLGSIDARILVADDARARLAADLGSRVVTAETAARAAEERARGAAAGVETLASVRLPAVEASLASTAATVNGFPARFGTIEKDLGTVSSALVATRNELGASMMLLSATVEGLPARMDLVEKSAAGASDVARGLESRVGALGDQIASVSARAASDVAGVRASVEAHDAALTTLRADVWSTTSSLTTMRAELTTASTSLATLSKQIDTTTVRTVLRPG